MKIDTPRLLLREYKASDWKRIHIYASDIRNIQHMNWGPNSESETKNALKSMMSLKDKKNRSQFELAVILKSESTLIGGCGIRIQDRANKSGDFGYVLNKSYWGNGYGLELSLALLNFGFKELKLHRIWATCSPDNIPSQKLLEKAGLIKEGHLRQNIQQRGKWRDSFLYSILESEWRNHKH